MTALNRDDYLDKVMGCWLGKNIGGTLGAPFEWRRQINEVSFYTQELKGEPLPNDDLDIQLFWLCALEEQGIDLWASTLADYWCLYVTPHWAEYGTAKTNLRAGLLPPLSGSYRNDFRHSCGAFIRSEIWACIAPGLPHVAAQYACEDGMIDHGNGEGTLAEIFVAAMESAAFVLRDLPAAIEVGLSYIPSVSGTAQAVRTAIRCHESGLDWRAARDEILRLHRGSTFFGWMHHTSETDRQKGFHEGILGYDAPSNVALLVLALLEGGEDFGRVVCTAVNCGEDTDCTAATAGALWGILHGARAIPHRWVQPIGRGIRTIAINLGDLRQVPRTVDELSHRTLRMAQQILARHRQPDFLTSGATNLTDVQGATLTSPDGGRSLWGRLSAVCFRGNFLTVWVDYGSSPEIRREDPKSIRVTIENTYRIQANLSCRWYLPEGWRVEPASEGFVLALHRPLGQPISIDVTFYAAKLAPADNRAVLEITCEGRPTVMLVPITLVNGSYARNLGAPTAP